MKSSWRSLLSRKQYKKYFNTLWILTLPLILQDILHTAVNLSDSFMIGTLGRDSINAVNFSNQLFFLYMLFVFGVCSGSAIFMGQYWGKRNISGIHSVMGICFILSFSISLLFASVAYFVPQLFLKLFSNNTQVLLLGEQYLTVVALSYLFTGITLTFSFALRSIAQTKIPMITTLIALFINVGLNFLFIFIFHWGVVGVAWATTISRIIELIVQLLIVFKYHLPIATSFKNYLHIKATFLKTFATTVTPVVLNECVWALGVVTYQIGYKGAGDDAQAAINISMPIFHLFNVIGMALGNATSIMNANLLGAGKIQVAKRYARNSMVLGFFFPLIMGGLLILTAPFFLKFYDVSPLVKQYTFYVIVVLGCYMVIRTFNFINLIGILRSGGDTMFCFILESISIWGIAVPLSFLGVYVFHLPIYLVVALVQSEELFKLWISTKRVLSDKWTKKIV